jgi:hypothetical protein
MNKIEYSDDPGPDQLQLPDLGLAPQHVLKFPLVLNADFSVVSRPPCFSPVR